MFNGTANALAELNKRFPTEHLLGACGIQRNVHDFARAHVGVTRFQRATDTGGNSVMDFLVAGAKAAADVEDAGMARGEGEQVSADDILDKDIVTGFGTVAEDGAGFALEQ